MPRPGSMFRRRAWGLLCLGLLAAGTPAVAGKPVPSVEAVWTFDAPPRPGAEIGAVLRITSHAPVRRLSVEMPDASTDPRVLEAFPRYQGAPAPETPLVFRARVRVPAAAASLEAVIRAETETGTVEIHARLDFTPPEYGPTRIPFRSGQDRQGTPLRVYAGEAPTPLVRRDAASAAAIVLSGRFLYRDRPFNPQGFVNAVVTDNPTLPVRFAEVELLENGTPVATAATDSAGAFAFPVTPLAGAAYQARVTTHTGAGFQPDLRVTVSSTDPTRFAALTAAVTDPATDVDLGDTVIEPGSGGEAFNILDTGVNGARFLAGLAGAPSVAALRLAWNPLAGWTTGFLKDGVVIQLDGDEGYDDCVILHEFGHYAAWIYSKDESPGGVHYVNVGGQDPRLSWSEGFASFFQSATRAWLGDPFPSWYVDTYGTPGQGQLFFSFDVEGPSYRISGVGSEVVVDALLWDIVDTSATPGDPQPGVDDDALSVPVAVVWSVIAGPMKTATTVTMEDFWDGWFGPSVNGGYETEMRDTFAALGLEYFPDAFESDTAGTPLAADGHAQHHTFYPAGDLDPAVLDLQAGDEITVETLNILSLGDTYLEVLDPSGAPIGQSDDRAPGDPSSAVSFTASRSGSYLVHVQRSYSGPLSRYTVYGSYDLRAVPGIPGASLLTELPASGASDAQAGAGVAFGDYNGDGLADLYLVNNPVAGTNTAKDVLFRNNGNRTFTQVTGSAGLGNPEGGVAVAWGDLDNDGDPDLFVSDHGLFRNEGGGRFVDITASAGIPDIGREFDAAWVDADLDGFLDLFVVRREGPSALWHNQGNGTFTDVAPGAGFGFAPPPGQDAYSCAWGDADGDGLPDVFMTFASGSSGQALFRNLGGNRFADVTVASGLLSADPATGGVWGDVNNDGALDLFVASLGKNRLYLNRGDGTFEDRSADYGVDDPGTAEGAAFADFDLDGDLDLYVVNLDGPGRLYRNLGGTMLLVPGAEDTNYGFGCAWGDIDNDGDPDLYVARGCGATCQANRLYENHAGDGTRPWLKVSLRGHTTNRDGLGARIRVAAGGLVQVRERGTGSGWAGKSLLPETFGWPTGAAGVDSVEVLWPSGTRDVVRNPAPDRVLTIGEGEGEIEPTQPELPLLQLDAAFPNPFVGATSLSFTLGRNARVRAEILDVAGRRVRLLLDADMPAGIHDGSWDGRDGAGRRAAAGIYFYRLQAGPEVAVRKVVRLAG